MSPPSHFVKMILSVKGGKGIIKKIVSAWLDFWFFVEVWLEL